MPTISTFYGITIRIYLKNKEHNPPHIHAFYKDYMATFLISSGELYKGIFPKRAEKMVTEFINFYRNELMEMWENENYVKLKGID